MSSRQKARTCSDFCRYADTKPTCVAAKTPSGHARSRRKPTWFVAETGSAALLTARICRHMGSSTPALSCLRATASSTRLITSDTTGRRV